MNRITYRTGYSKASMALQGRMIVVNHSRYSSAREIATAARECNYRAGNWNRSNLSKIGSADTDKGRVITVYEIV